MARPTKDSMNPALTDPSADVTLESLWSELMEEEKIFIMVFPFFDTYKQAAAFMGKQYRWYIRKTTLTSRRAGPFRRAMKLRRTTTDEAAMSLLKVDLAGKALARTAVDIRDGKVDQKELRGLLRTFTGKAKPSKDQARKGNLVDLRSVTTWEDNDDEEEENAG